jgi:alanyl-tRNA synthetase
VQRRLVRKSIGGVSVLARVLDGVPAKELRGLVDEGKKSIGSGVIAYVGVEDGKAALAVGVTDDLKGKVSAVDLVKAGVAAVGGQGGGGAPTWRRAAGRTAAKQRRRSTPFAPRCKARWRRERDSNTTYRERERGRC